MAINAQLSFPGLPVVVSVGHLGCRETHQLQRTGKESEESSPPLLSNTHCSTSKGGRGKGVGERP